MLKTKKIKHNINKSLPYSICYSMYMFKWIFLTKNPLHNFFQKPIKLLYSLSESGSDILNEKLKLYVPAQKPLKNAEII